MKKNFLFLLICFVLVFSGCSNNFDDSYLLDKLNQLSEKDKEQDEDIESLKKRIESIEKYFKNFEILENSYKELLEKITKLHEKYTESQEKYTELQNSIDEKYTESQEKYTELLDKITKLQEIFSIDKQKLLDAFEGNETILNKTIEELSEDIVRLEKMIENDKDIEKLREEIKVVSDKVANIKEIDLITVDENYVFFWNTKEKLLYAESKNGKSNLSTSYSENEIIWTYRYFDNTYENIDTLKVNKDYLIHELKYSADRNAYYRIYCFEHNRGFYIPKEKIFYNQNSDICNIALQDDSLGKGREIVGNDIIKEVIGQPFTENDTIYNTFMKVFHEYREN